MLNDTDNLRNWTLTILALAFFTLYGLALMLWLDPTIAKILIRLESIIFLMIGYYFGRLPSGQTEKTLTEKIMRQTMLTDVAEMQTQQVLRSNEALNERLKDVRAILSCENAAKASSSGSRLTQRDDVGDKEDLTWRLRVARRILKS